MRSAVRPLSMSLDVSGGLGELTSDIPANNRLEAPVERISARYEIRPETSEDFSNIEKAPHLPKRIKKVS